MHYSEASPLTFDAEFFADPFAAYARLRELGPVHPARTPDDSPVWLVTRYADVRAALVDPRLSVDRAHSRTGYQGFSLPPALDSTLLNLEAPDHTRVRRIHAKAFTPRRIEALRPRVQDIADELLDALADRHEADLISEYAIPLPGTVICELLGVAEANHRDVKSWIVEMFTPSSADAAREAIVEFARFLPELVGARRADPGDDLLSALIAARDEEGRLSEDELTSSAFGILLGGFGNPVDLLGNGLAALLSHPDQIAAVRADPALVPGAIEEMLRFDSPTTMAIRRFALEDLDVGGVTIPAGDTVLLSIVSANRDPEAVAEPDVLDVAGRDNAHLGFGHGPHFCLGAVLGRMEMTIALETLLRRFPDLRLAKPVEQLSWRQSFRSRGLHDLPVLLGPHD